MVSRRGWQYRFFLVLLLVGGVTQGAVGQTLPALPQSAVDTSYPAMSGRTTTVPAGGNLQSAINAAVPGDTLLLTPGATYTGSFTLPAKSGSGWIVIRTGAPESSIPPAGVRITPAYVSAMPKIVSPNSGPAIQTASGARNYRITGVEITMASGVSINYGLVLFGDGGGGQSSLGSVPQNLVLDRSYVHGFAGAGLRRGVALNCASCAVVDSYIAEVHEVGADSQAIAGWNGPGPFKIANCYLEAAGENVMFGGADPRIPNLVPADIQILGNHFYKPVSWRGSSWQIKNLFELKNARRVLVDGNVLEHNWPAAQNGFSILFTPRNQDHTAPWSVVEDVTFTHNIVRHIASAMNIYGTDNLAPSQPTHRILIKNNVYEDVGGSWGSSGRLFQVLWGTTDVTIDHNTAFHSGDVIMAESPANNRFTYTNNLTPHNQYGVAGTGTTGNPALTLSTFFPGVVFLRNVLSGGRATSYPANNYFPATLNDVRFVDMAGGNYRLQAASPYKNAGTDGRDVGADIDAVAAATAGAVSGGSYTPPPPPPVDTTPPATSITAPVAGATVTATVTITATASDNVGVAGVRFFLDGTPLGAEDSAAPYQYSWDTRGSSNGPHTLSAVARDAANNTTTSAGVNVTVSNATAVQSPYSGTPIAIPGQFEAENFDRGGEGLAYHDLSAGNQGGQYRTTEDVDIVTAASGYAVNNFQTGEWLEFTIQVAQSGTYRFDALVSSEYTTAGFHVEIDGADKTGLVGIPSTGHWTAFQWIGKGGISLTSGQHILRMFANAEYFNFDAFRITVEAPPPDTAAPSVTVTAPASGATVSATVNVTANAADNVAVAGVQFYVDGVALGSEDAAPPYEASWNTTTAANGSHALTAAARDAAGNRTTSSSVMVTVSNAVPQSPYSGVPMAAPGQFEAEDYDRGGEGTAYHDVSAGNQGGVYRTAEDVDITQPAGVGYAVNNFQTGEWLEYTIQVAQTATYTLEALISSEYVTSRFHIEIDAADVTGLVNVPSTGRWTTFQWVGKGGITLSAGPHVLRLFADAEYFNVDALRITEELPPADTTPPAVSIHAPGDGATLSATFVIAASASDDVAVAGVEFLVDGVVRGDDTTAPYQWSWNTTGAANGAHTLAATARDGAGNRATSAPIGVTVANATADTTAPTVSITTPSGGATVSSTITLAASASDNTGVAGVRFYVDGNAVGSEDTAAPYEVLWNSAAVPDGSRMLTAVARDAAGNTATSAVVLVTVSNAPPPVPGGHRSPYHGTAFVVPGRFEAEDFDRGGEGLAYHDRAPGNQGGTYRPDEDVDIISPYALGYVVNNFQTGEWLEYSIDVASAGTYRVEALVSSQYLNSRLHIEVDRVDVSGAIDVPSTGSWVRFQWVGKSGISLSAGRHILRIHAGAEYFNLDAVVVSQETRTTTARVRATKRR
jgi:hypothetical protein